MKKTIILIILLLIFRSSVQSQGEPGDCTACYSSGGSRETLCHWYVSGEFNHECYAYEVTSSTGSYHTIAGCDNYNVLLAVDPYWDYAQYISSHLEEVSSVFSHSTMNPCRFFRY